LDLSLLAGENHSFLQGEKDALGEFVNEI